MDFSDLLETSFFPGSKRIGFKMKIDKTTNSTAAMIIPFLFFLCSPTISKFRAIYFGPENIKNILQLNYYIRLS